MLFTFVYLKSAILLIFYFIIGDKIEPHREVTILPFALICLCHVATRRYLGDSVSLWKIFLLRPTGNLKFFDLPPSSGGAEVNVFIVINEL